MTMWDVFSSCTTLFGNKTGVSCPCPKPRSATWPTAQVAVNPRWIFALERDGDPVAVCLAVARRQPADAEGRTGRLAPVRLGAAVLRVEEAEACPGHRPRHPGRRAEPPGSGRCSTRRSLTGLYNDGMDTAEASWTLATNHRINKQLEDMGARRYKTWRLYQHSLAHRGRSRGARRQSRSKAADSTWADVHVGRHPKALSLGHGQRQGPVDEGGPVGPERAQAQPAAQLRSRRSAPARELQTRPAARRAVSAAPSQSVVATLTTWPAAPSRPQQVAADGEQPLDGIVLVQPLHGLRGAPDGGDDQAVAPHRPGHPGIGVRPEHGRQTHDGPGDRLLATDLFRRQLVCGIGALGVGPGIVALAQGQRVVRPRPVHGGRRGQDHRSR